MSDTKHYLKLLLTNIHKKYSLKDTIDKNEYSFTMMKLSQNNITPQEALMCYLDQESSILDPSNEVLDNTISLLNYLLSYITANFNIKTIAGCYKITNRETGEIYIGETVNMFARFSQHISMLYNGTHHCIALQESFNKNKEIDRFSFKPIFFFETSYYKGRAVTKTRTLYLEAAYYLTYRYKKYVLYNTKNPFLELKNNEKKTFDNYEVIYKDVLQMIYDDPDKILSENLKEKVRKNLNEKGIHETLETKQKKKHSHSKSREYIGVDTENGTYEYNNKTYPLCPGEKYSFTSLTESLCDNGILLSREEHDYLLFKKTLVYENLLNVDNSNRFFARESSLTDGYLELKHFKTCNSDLYRYQITEKGKDRILEIINQYGKDYFKRQD